MQKQSRPINPCGKRVDIENPYEIWSDGSFEYRVLKKYQAPEKEATNPNARWHVATKSPFTHGMWEYGDAYVRDIKKLGTVRIK